MLVYPNSNFIFTDLHLDMIPWVVKKGNLPEGNLPGDWTSPWAYGMPTNICDLIY